jgi:hypothetical protein
MQVVLAKDCGRVGWVKSDQPERRCEGRCRFLTVSECAIVPVDHCFWALKNPTPVTGSRAQLRKGMREASF